MITRILAVWIVLAVAVGCLQAATGQTSRLTLLLEHAVAGARPAAACPMEADTVGGPPIRGSAEFVGRTRGALRLIRDTSGWRYVQALSGIEERNQLVSTNTLAQHDPMTGLAEVKLSTARRGCADYVETLVHEGAHAVLGAYHPPVYAAAAKARRELRQ